MNRRRYLIETFGCQMNVHDSERMAGLLEQAGYEPTAERRRRRRHRHQHLQRARARRGEALHAARRAARARRGDRPHARSSPSPAASRSRKATRCFKKTNGHVIDVVLGTQRLKMLPVLVERAADAVGAARGEVDVDAVGRRDVPARHHAARRRGQGLRDDHRGVQRPLRVLRRAVHARARAHARQGRHPGRRARGGGLGPEEVQLLGQIVNHYQAPDDPACDFAQLLAEVDEVPGVERIRFASPHPRHTGARLIEAVRDLPQRLQAPAPAGAVRLDAGAAGACGAGTRARSISIWSARSARRSRASRSRPTSSSASRARRRRLRRHAVARRGRSLPQHVLVQVLGAAEHARVEAAAGRRARGGEDGAHRGAAVAAAGHPDAAARGGRSARWSTCWSTRSSRRRDGEMSGRTSGNTVVSFPVPADGPGGRTDSWIGRTVPVRVTRAGPHSLAGSMPRTQAATFLQASTPC